jgi:hypothetical protein
MQTRGHHSFFVIYQIKMPALVRWHARLIINRYRPSPRIAQRQGRLIL